MKSNWLKLAGSILTGVLLAISFPKFNFSTLIFISFTPLLFVLKLSGTKHAIFFSWIAGIVFFCISLFWIFNIVNFIDGYLLKVLSILGCILLFAYCAIYFIPFGLLASHCFRSMNSMSIVKNIFIMLFLTLVWTASEYLRSILLTGFPWNLLGVSQYANPAIIQISSFGGVYLVSSIIIWMNLGIFITLLQYFNGKNKRGRRPHYELIIGIIPLALSIAYGMNQLFDDKEIYEKFKIAVIQPNINQKEKIKMQRNNTFPNNLKELSYSALKTKDLHLLIWPETALPNYASRYKNTENDLINSIVKTCPLLTGVVDVKIKKDHKFDLYNASILFEEHKEIVSSDNIYYKNHLVPFGEFIPLNDLFRSITSLGTSFKSGDEIKVFQTKKSPPFSVLICFEDIFPSIANKSVKIGSKCLINQTNDAWFDPSSQSHQHMSHAIFRCIENNVPMIRACNTGISCIIDHKGRVRQSIKPLTKGFIIAEVRLAGQSKATFYTKFGDIYPRITVLLSIIITLLLYSKRGIRL